MIRSQPRLPRDPPELRSDSLRGQPSGRRRLMSLGWPRRWSASADHMRVEGPACERSSNTQGQGVNRRSMTMRSRRRHVRLLAAVGILVMVGGVITSLERPPLRVHTPAGSSSTGGPRTRRPLSFSSTRPAPMPGTAGPVGCHHPRHPERKPHALAERWNGSSWSDIRSPARRQAGIRPLRRQLCDLRQTAGVSVASRPSCRERPERPDGTLERRWLVRWRPRRRSVDCSSR